MTTTNPQPSSRVSLTKKFTLNAQTVGSLTVGTIPANYRVMSANVTTEALGSSTTLALGVTGTTGLFITAASTASATELSMTRTVAGGVGNVSTSDRTALLTLAGATTTASDKIVYVDIELVPDFQY